MLNVVKALTAVNKVHVVVKMDIVGLEQDSVMKVKGVNYGLVIVFLK